MTMDPAAFWSQVAVGGPDDCWPWQGALSSSGYGNVKWDSGDGRGVRNQGAHRVAYSLEKGPIPLRRVLLHSCDVRYRGIEYRRCCNPAHLEPGTHGDNARDRAEKHRGRGQSRGGVRPPEGRKYW